MGLFPQQIFEGTSWRRKHGEPKTRVQLFQCVFTDQFSSLIPVNFLYLLFWLPAMAWTGICLVQVLGSMQVQDSARTMAVINTWTVGLIPCITLLGPARAGMALLMRNWAREDYTKVLPTFWKGLRENWKQMLAPSFLTGLLPMALWSAYQMSVEGAGILLVILCIAAVLFFLVMQVYPVLLVTYDLKMRHHFRNAVLLCVIKLPWFLGVFLGTSFFLLLNIGFSYLYSGAAHINVVLALVYYSLIGLATTELANAALANKLCDLYFNKEAEQSEIVE